MNDDFIITKIDNVIFVGDYQDKEKQTSFTSYLRSHELILHLSGKTMIRFNGKTLYCEEDTLRFLPKGENHEYTVFREEMGGCIDIFFDTNVPIAEEAFTLNLKKRAAITNLFKKIFSVWVSKNDGYYFKCISLLYAVFSEIQGRNYIPENQYKTIKPAIEYINKNFLNEKISVVRLAELCEISESYFKKLFIKKFGVPPTRYIISLKINHACGLLHTGLYTVAQVADICGYNNPHFFSRQFKEYIGISPKMFIEKYPD